MTDTIPDTITPAEQEELGRLMDFVNANPDMDDETLLDELEKRFSKTARDSFVAAFTGITPE